MRWIGFTLLLFLLFPSISNAAYTYIKVTKTKKTDKLQAIKSHLKRLGLSSTHRTTKKEYIIYTGPYKNSASAKRALKKVKKYFKYPKIIKTKTKLNTKKVRKQPSSKQLLTKKKLFVGGSIGYSSSELTNSASVILQNPPKDKGISYDLHLGYNLTKEMFLTVGYLRSDMQDLVFDNFYGSYNYKFGPYGEYSPYFGVLAGYSKLTWNKSPIDNATSTNTASDSFFAGSQAGIIYNGYEKIAFYSNYQCLFMNHATAIDVTNKLKHKTLHNIQIGVQYSF